MKKIISFVLAFMMSLNICIIANAESILTGSYTFIDSAYSPELDMYVVMAKDFTSGSHTTELYKSTDGVNWTKVLTEPNGKNYANQKVRQNLVWWEEEQVFVAHMGSTLFISSDGTSWSKKSGNSNAVIETNGKVLITSAGKALRIYENLADSPELVEFTTNSNYYTKTVGLTDDGNNITIFDQYTVYYITGETRDAALAYPNMEGTPMDTVKVPGLDCWITVLDKAKIRVWTLPKNLIGITPTLEDGSANTEKITGVGASNKYIVIGTETGKLLYTEAAEIGAETVWKEVQLAKGISEGPKDQITSVSAAENGAFVVTSDKGIYSLAESEGTLLLVDPTAITIEAEMPRIEIPFEGSSVVTITPDVFDYKGTQIFDGITDFVMETTESGVSAFWDGSKLVIEVGQSANGGSKKFVATDKNGGEHEFEIMFVKETDVELEGFTSVAMAGYGEEKVEYSYKAHVLGSDGEKMNRTASMEVIDLPEKVEFDTETGVLTIYSGAEAGIVKIKVTSDGNTDNFKEFEVEIKECEPSTIEFTEGEDLIVIPDGKKENYQYDVLIKDQVARPMPDEKINWTLETPFEGVSINNDGVLTVEEITDKGEITIIAQSEKAENLKISRKVTLEWSDLRCIKEDLEKIEESVITGENLLLPTEGENGTTFTWTTSDKNVITADGVITSDNQKDTKATLTVTGEKNDSKVSKAVSVTVLKTENIANVGDFEDQNSENLNGEITTDANSGEYALKVNGDISFDVELNNESSYVFEAYIKGSGNIELKTEIAGKLASVKADDGFVKITGNYDYRKQNKSFTDTVTLSSASEFIVDDIKIYEITLEYEAVMEVIAKAEYSKKKADITAAKEAVENFLDIPLKKELQERVDKIKPKTTGGGGGGTGGSGGGVITPSETSSATTGMLGETVNNDEKVYEGLLIFKDLSKHWAKDDVEYMANLGIVSGVSETEFNPDANITRAELAKLIVKTVGLDESLYKNTYYDVLAEDWYSGYAQAAKDAGYISGYNGLFRPDDKITREEMAKVIAAAYVQKSGKKLEQGGALYFTDIENISGWAYDYVVLATREGFIKGITEEVFAPKDNATRAQAVVMLKRLYDKLNAE